jgi:hypothetical protein
LPVKPRRISCAAFSRISCELASLYHAVRGVHIKLTASFNGPKNKETKILLFSKEALLRNFL